jgi:hypothetical protein
VQLSQWREQQGGEEADGGFQAEKLLSDLPESLHDFPGIIKIARLIGEHHCRREPAAGMTIEQFLPRQPNS